MFSKFVSHVQNQAGLILKMTYFLNESREIIWLNISAETH